MTLPGPRFTYEDYKLLGDDKRYEVIEGDLLVTPAPNVRHGPPDLVVEILSPSTAGRDQVIKRKLYGKYGVREYWVVDPEGCTLEVLTQAPGGLDTWRVFPVGSEAASPLLPGLSIPVADLFIE
ncbi:MAG TPA: Uma2 family endonuclease [Symbiobacteriaceae bacterium]|nr:Uma2 family endonuclease [Symbiobacteriaceae bacterium]